MADDLERKGKSKKAKKGMLDTRYLILDNGRQKGINSKRRTSNIELRTKNGRQKGYQDIRRLKAKVKRQKTVSNFLDFWTFN